MPDFPKTLDLGAQHLRPLVPSDTQAIIHQLNDPSVGRWLAAVNQPFGPAEAEALLEHAEQPDTHLRGIDQDGTLVGCLCIGPTLWYWLAPDFFSKGIMTRALTAAISARFSALAPPITATCHEHNLASRALLQRLGFAASPATRRMFFHGTGHAEPCRDYLMAPEQWHLLHPPAIDLGSVTLRPARQTDAGTLGHVPPGPAPWPSADALPAFIEEHRFRGGRHGLFMIRDGNRRDIGLALFRDHETVLRFLTDEDDLRHRQTVDAALARGLDALLNP